MENSGKPPQVIDKIIEGKLGSFYEQVVLVDQPSIRDPKTTVGQMLQAAIAKLGENIGSRALRAVQGGERRRL
jgi:elongation factor Ts